MPAHSSYTLLLVDDNPVNLQLITQIIALDLPRVQVLTAADAREGLILEAEQQVDGAFIDVQMPGMDGETLPGHRWRSMSFESWRGLVTTQRSEWSVRAKSTLRMEVEAREQSPTNASGSSSSESWPTASSRDWKDSAGMNVEAFNPGGSGSAVQAEFTCPPPAVPSCS